MPHHHLSASDLIHHYSLERHPEGGYYKETYRSRESYHALPLPFAGDRHYSTAILFLLPQGTRSMLHRIASDEVWHFYLGGPLTLFHLSPDGVATSVTLGHDVARGEELQYVVPAGHWFGAIPAEKSDFSFVGCTVSPGFHFDDFELAKREDLIAKYPSHHTMITALTSPHP